MRKVAGQRCIHLNLRCALDGLLEGAGHLPAGVLTQRGLGCADHRRTSGEVEERDGWAQAGGRAQAQAHAMLEMCLQMAKSRGRLCFRMQSGGQGRMLAQINRLGCVWWPVAV